MAEPQNDVRAIFLAALDCKTAPETRRMFG